MIATLPADCIQVGDTIRILDTNVKVHRVEPSTILPGRINIYAGVLALSRYPHERLTVVIQGDAS